MNYYVVTKITDLKKPETTKPHKTIPYTPTKQQTKNPTQNQILKSASQKEKKINKNMTKGIEI